MYLLDLCDDILNNIINELFIVRNNRCICEFKKEWINRRPYNKIILCGGRRLHPGRIFLNHENNIDTVKLIDFTDKYFVANILLTPTIKYMYNPRYEPIQYGLKIYVKKKSIRRKLKYISLNKWDDFDEQTDDTIIRYLMNKEHLRTIM